MLLLALLLALSFTAAGATCSLLGAGWVCRTRAKTCVLALHDLCGDQKEKCPMSQPLTHSRCEVLLPLPHQPQQLLQQPPRSRLVLPSRH